MNDRARSKQISIRVNEVEHALIKNTAAISGLDLNCFILHLITSKVTKVIEVRNERFVDVCERHYEALKKQANNLNQIAKVVNSKKMLTDEQFATLASIGRNIDKLIHILEAHTQRSELVDNQHPIKKS